MGGQDIGSDEIQADEMLLAGETYFNFSIAGVAWSAVLHGFFEVGQGCAVELAQLDERWLSLHRIASRYSLTVLAVLCMAGSGWKLMILQIHGNGRKRWTRESWTDDGRRKTACTPCVVLVTMLIRYEQGSTSPCGDKTVHEWSTNTRIGSSREAAIRAAGIRGGLCRKQGWTGSWGIKHDMDTRFQGGCSLHRKAAFTQVTWV